MDFLYVNRNTKMSNYDIRFNVFVIKVVEKDIKKCYCYNK